jgi:pyruvate kinase
VRDIERIVGVSDALMVARGDLALEVGAAHVPLLQKRIIALANKAGLPVITATQMLDSMIRNPNPTRAETSDVANAILDGTDAVMLSGETAVGRYPVRAVQEMASIAHEAETALRFGRAPHGELPSGSPVATAVAHAGVEIATRLEVAAVAAATTTGRTARMVARFRPRMPLVGVTGDPAVGRRLALVWGVRPVVVDSYETTEEMVAITARALEMLEVARAGDRFVVISGQPIGRPGSTNMVQVRRVGDDEPQPSSG